MKRTLSASAARFLVRANRLRPPRRVSSRVSGPPTAGGGLGKLTRKKHLSPPPPPFFGPGKPAPPRHDGFHREFQGRQPLAVGFTGFNTGAQTGPWPSAPPTRTSNGTLLWPRPARAPSVRHSVLSTSC